MNNIVVVAFCGNERLKLTLTIVIRRSHQSLIVVGIHSFFTSAFRSSSNRHVHYLSHFHNLPPPYPTLSSQLHDNNLFGCIFLICQKHTLYYFRPQTPRCTHVVLCMTMLVIVLRRYQSKIVSKYRSNQPPRWELHSQLIDHILLQTKLSNIRRRVSNARRYIMFLNSRTNDIK